MHRWVISLVFTAGLLGAAPTAEQLEFFEKKIRPLLVENCYACHSGETMASAGLRLDTGPAMRKGGSRGPAVVPGDPAHSLILAAVSYRKLDLKMPPAGKLSDEQIADLTAWIAMGAPDPREEQPAVATASAEGGIDFDEARKFWAFQPVVEPNVPEVKRPEWVRTPVDAFILAKLTEKGLQPAPEAGRRTLLRRVTYDLTGLPPAPEEIEDFLADGSPDAYEKVVERLLASPHYGERWARHWLDLVRYAETNGHEFDNNKLDAWRYRDYVVRAFHQDLPYDRFLREQLAGDLLERPRLTPDGERLETPIASGMYWLWEVLNSPTDSVKARADQVDNQIDVVGKALFGLTIACARCHDHKFDPIPTADYYSLAGVLHSTRLNEVSIDAPQRRQEIERIAAELERLRRPDRAGRLAAANALARNLLNPDASWGERLAAAREEPSDPLYPFARLAETAEEPFQRRLLALRVEMEEWAAKADPDHPLWKERGDWVFDDFSGDYAKWRVAGAAFGEAPSASGHADSQRSGAGQFTGLLTTNTFSMPKLYAHIRLAGTQDDPKRKELAQLRVTLWADDHPSLHLAPQGSRRLAWQSLTLTKEIGRTGYLQIVDRSRDGHIVVDKIVFSDSEEPPPIAGPVQSAVLELLNSPEIDSLEALARAYGGLAKELCGKQNRAPDEETLLADLIGPLAPPAAAAERFAELVSSLPEAAYAMSSMDADPRNIRIHVRGNHKNLGEEVPRRFLQVIAGEDQEPFSIGSGRLEFAEWAASERNPLTARVFVNRVWAHHFGRGIVGTPDNFGETGERPTHPQLLDFLAARFMKQGWSVKQLHRGMVLSSAYRMDSRRPEKARREDPGNRYLSHMPVRRLEAEAIRDAVLAVAGTLDTRVGGPSVPPHISEFQDGRGKPPSGPLDGEGRRSLYIGVRRNFLTPMFLAFDYPPPISTIGQRGVSAVPSQALILLNNALIHQQAALWAGRELSRPGSASSRIAAMFERAFARLPENEERDQIQTFLAEQRKRYGAAPDAERRAWADLAHVLINSTEFIFIR